MAGGAIGGIGITLRRGLPVNAAAKVFDLLLVTLGAFGGNQLICRFDIVNIAMAGLAGIVTQHAVNAIGYLRSFVGMAGRALRFHDFGGVRVVFDVGMAVGARENAVNAGRMFGGIDEDAVARRRSHARLAVAGETGLILLGSGRGGLRRAGGSF